MNSFKVVLVVTSLLGLTIFTASAEEQQFNELFGSWQVDLRPTPISEPYFQIFAIDKIEGKKFSGSFYGTPFNNGVINVDWGVVYFAFTTADGRSNYHHSGKLEGDKIVGRTHAPERGMLSIWTAKKMSK